MKENLRYTNWNINSNLTSEESEKVKDVSEKLLEVLKASGLSHFQAESALELAKVTLQEYTV